MKDLIDVIATQVRIWAERRARGTINSQDLNGWCAIANTELHRKLALEGIPSTINMATADIGCHVFLTIDDHIADVTATQFPEFRNQPVVVAHEREIDSHWYYQSDKTFDTPEELISYQTRMRWPKSQIAYAARKRKQ